MRVWQRSCTAVRSLALFTVAVGWCVVGTAGWVISQVETATSPALGFESDAIGVQRHRRSEPTRLPLGPRVRCGGGLHGASVILPGESDPEWLDGGAGRARRQLSAAPLAANRSCDIAIDIDPSFVAAWARQGATEAERQIHAKIRAEEFASKASELFNLPQNEDTAIKIRIVTSSVPALRFTSTSGQNDVLSLMSRYRQTLYEDAVRTPASRDLRPQWQPRADQVCLNVLFTSVDLGGVMGAAIQGETDPSIVGGVCDSRLRHSLASNVAVVNTQATTDAGASPWQVLLSTSHELAHAMGASHDCELTDITARASGVDTCPADSSVSSTCVPPASSGGPHLMFPTIDELSGDAFNNRVLSECSVSRINRVLATQGGCLSTVSCADGAGPCCAGNTPLPDGTSCVDVANGTCTSGRCVVCPGGGTCAPVSPPPLVSGCSYTRVASPTSQCSEACGDANRSVLMVCMCGEVVSTDSEACSGPPEYFATEQCNVAPCDTTAPHAIALELHNVPASSVSDMIEYHILSALGIHVQILKRVLTASGSVGVKMQSCRYFASGYDCVSAATLATWLAAPANRSMLASALGYDVAILESTAAVDGSDAPFLTIDQTWLAAVAVAIGGLIFGCVSLFLDQRDRKKRAATRRRRSAEAAARRQRASGARTSRPDSAVSPDIAAADVAMHGTRGRPPVASLSPIPDPDWDASIDSGSTFGGSLTSIACPATVQAQSPLRIAATHGQSMAPVLLPLTDPEWDETTNEAFPRSPSATV